MTQEVVIVLAGLFIAAALVFLGMQIENGLIILASAIRKSFGQSELK